jgi:hypothetical protein
MPRPTPRAVLIFAAGIPLALFVVIYQPSWWVLSFNYGVLVVLAALTDLLLAFPPRLLNVKVVTPDRLYIGERGASTLTLAAGPRALRCLPSRAATSIHPRSWPARCRPDRTQRSRCRWCRAGAGR